MRKICVINNKGGVAKTTTAINLAAGLARQGKNTILVDLDPQNNINLALQAKAEYTVVDAMTGKAPLSQVKVNLGKNLDVVAAEVSLTHLERQLSTHEDPNKFLKDVLDDVKTYDYMILDCPASMSLLNEAVLNYCEEAFIPTSTDYLGWDALQRTMNVIAKIQARGSGIKVTRVVPTMFDKRNKICKETLAQIQNEYPELASYPIRMNSKLKEAPKHGKSIFSYAKSSPGAKDYGRLVDDVLAMEVLIQN